MEHITKEIKLRNQCQWYKDGEKSTKFFLNFKKAKTTRSTIKMLKKNIGK